MKVEIRESKPDVYLGDIIQFDGKPCMVIYIWQCPNAYGILSLAESNGGSVIETFKTLTEIDSDSRTERVLIRNSNVSITSKGGAEECPF